MHALPETLTLAQAKAAVLSIEQQLAEDGAQTDALVVDASALRHFDTAAIAVLLEVRRLAQASGRTLNVQGAPAAMVELSGLYGVQGLLGFASGGAAAAHSARA